MRIGTRILHPPDIERWPSEIVQISVYRGIRDSLSLVRQCTTHCREAGIPAVIHPVNYSLFDPEAVRELHVMAAWADLGMILHDEKKSCGRRIKGRDEVIFRDAIEKLSSRCPLSFENSTDTGDVLWFWSEFADSVTIDLGHVEAWGLDSVSFVMGLGDAVIGKIRYVHMHRNNGWSAGLTDHWPITDGCREVRALRELLSRKTDIDVLLEINETDMVDDNLLLLRKLRDEVKHPGSP